MLDFFLDSRFHGNDSQKPCHSSEEPALVKTGAGIQFLVECQIKSLIIFLKLA
jgi:hypothetical protein